MFIHLIMAAVLHASPLNTPFSPPEQNEEIVVQNRILTKVNDKTISVLDVVKQMDVFLSRHYPHLMDSKAARFQYYSSQWRDTLQHMIDSELMMADAESREVKVSDGEIREEVQSRFGPNVMTALDKLGISYDEAWKLVHQDMIVQRIQWLRVTSKAFQKVTSQEIKKAYEQYLVENPGKDEYKYQFLTIRAENSDTSRTLADKVVSLKERVQCGLMAAADLFKEQTPLDTATSITVSQEFVQEEKALSQAHKAALAQLKAGEWSQPTVQVSRDGSSVVRIFHLKEHTKIPPPAFTTLANELKQALLNQYANQESDVYLAKLHQRFGFDENGLDIPPHFEPFSLK